MKRKKKRMKKRGRDGDALNGMGAIKRAHMDGGRKKIIVEGSAPGRHFIGLLSKTGLLTIEF